MSPAEVRVPKVEGDDEGAENLVEANVDVLQAIVGRAGRRGGRHRHEGVSTDGVCDWGGGWRQIPEHGHVEEGEGKYALGDLRVKLWRRGKGEGGYVRAHDAEGPQKHHGDNKLPEGEEAFQMGCANFLMAGSLILASRRGTDDNTPEMQ